MKIIVLESAKWPKGDFRKDKTTDVEDACEERVTLTKYESRRKIHLIYEYICAFSIYVTKSQNNYYNRFFSV